MHTEYAQASPHKVEGKSHADTDTVDPIIIVIVSILDHTHSYDHIADSRKRKKGETQQPIEKHLYNYPMPL